MRQGRTEKAILETALKTKMPIPDSIKKAPSLLPGLVFYYQAFLDLSTCRSIGMTEGPIPWNMIDSYAHRNNLEGDDYDRFFILIRGMDAEYIKHKEEEHKKAAKK